MGGKNKVANRTKNNARPSNSGRSAELLGSSVTQFAGFSGLKDSTFGLPLGVADEDALVDPEVNLILKKISKKDPTTKIKGLQELAEFVKNAEQSSLKPILPVWTRFYGILVTDIDNRVRETTHSVHRQIVLKAKKSIIPHLKQLMAPWFTSQYDTYPPAASTALQAFKDAFPANKFQEAIIYCQEDILGYIYDNLFIQTPQSLSNLKHVSTEEAEAKYERVLISCLQGYCLYLEKVSSENIEKTLDLNNKIISSAKYWKFAKHKLTNVRAAWFKVLAIICQKAVFLLEGNGAQATHTVFSNLEENDPIVLKHVWESVLMITSSLKDWWTFINVERLFYPKLWKVLKQAGQGNAAVIYPSLLPLLSHLSSVINGNSSQFYNTFFENLRTGLKNKSTSSPSELSAVVTSFSECLQYVIQKMQHDQTLCKTLIETHLIPTLEWCLIEDHSFDKLVFKQVAHLVQTWSHNSNEAETFSTFVEFFFQRITTLFNTILFAAKEDNSLSIASKQLQFLQFLKHNVKPKKEVKVQFSETESVTTTDNSHLCSADKVVFNNSYLEKMNNLVYVVSDSYVKWIEEKRSKDLIENLCSLLHDFTTKDFFSYVDQKAEKQNPNSRLIDAYRETLFRWLGYSELRSKYVVDLLFLLLRYVQEDDKKAILETLLQNDDSLTWSIQDSLVDPYNKDPLICDWLRNEKISQFLVSLADKEINDESTSELNVLFKAALTENEGGKLLIHEEAVTKIINKFIAVLKDYRDYPITADTCVSLAAYISTVIYTESLLLSYEHTLLLALFRFSCKSDIDREIVSTETIHEATNAWQDSLTLLINYLSKEECKAVTIQFANIFEQEFLTKEPTETQMNHIIYILVKFLMPVYKRLPLSFTEFLLVFFRRPFLDSWQSDLCKLCQAAEYVQGNLSSPYDDIVPPSDELKEKYIAQYFAWQYLITGVMASNLEKVPVDENEEEEEGLMSPSVNILHITDESEQLFANILHSLSICRTYLKIFKNTEHFDTILTFCVLIEINIKHILENVDRSFKTKLKDILKEKALKDCWFWCETVYILHEEFLSESSLVEVYDSIVSGNQEKHKLGCLHLMQVFGENLNYDYVQNYEDLIGNAIALKSLIHCKEIDVQIAEALAKVEKLRAKNVPQFLYDTNDISWQDSQEIIEVVKLCSALMKEKFVDLTQKYWDFGVFSLVSWASNCLKLRASFETYQFQALLVAVVKMYIHTDTQIRNMEKEEIKSNYIDEWKDVLVESIHSDLAQMWLYLGEMMEQKQDKLITYIPLIREFGAVVNNLNHQFLLKTNDTSLPKWTKFFKRGCSLLINSQATLQLWGYKMLLTLVPGLIKIDTEAVDSNMPHKKGLIFEQFKEKLVETQEIVNSILIGIRLGEDSCTIKPSTDSFTYTFAYLLFWDILFTLCELASTELKYQYADWLRNEDLLKNFLNNLFRLMPSEVFQHTEEKSKIPVEYFLKKTEMDLKETCDSKKIELLACWLYSSALTQLPALVRQWWTGLDTKVAQVVERVTSMYVSPHSCTKELNEVMTYQSKFKNMVLKVIAVSREIIAIYTVDEAQVELVITLPSNYPLGGVDVQCSRQIGGSGHKQWLLQFKKCVLHQNGRIWDGLSLWNNNLDRKFDGVEECYICFAVLHPGTYQLPKLSCQTCKKKFHSACLYKWFRTSYKSSCPICRNLF